MKDVLDLYEEPYDAQYQPSTWMKRPTTVGRRLIQSTGVIFISSGGFSRGNVSARSHSSRTLVQTGARIVVRRYNQQGPQALSDQRKQSTGAPALLSRGQKKQLLQLL